MFLDWTFVLLIPALLLAMWAQAKVKSAYHKYSQVGVRSGVTGAEVAQYILRNSSIPIERGTSMGGSEAVGLEAIPGNMTDHYDPRSRTLRLSEDVYHGRSIAALGIAAHEVGHAIQHAQGYAPMSLRTIVYPVSSIGSTLAWPLFIGGFIFQLPFLLNIGILLYSAAVLFTLVTLPVEFNASRRAVAALSHGGYLTEDELHGVKKVLSAAAMTYVAATAMAAMQLLRMILMSQRR
jgi:hypothetical protein